ncbi:MAG: helix-turn-helix transcriptional regulator, partial [Planctomycetes bacterium]|nr:helix-turn-helix transcriptional regulator [Planctomycetota bacterium]
HQLIADAHLAASEFYNDYLRRFDCFYVAGGILFEQGPSMTGMGVMRSRRQGPADDRSMRLLAALMPHQRKAVLMERRLGELRAAGRLADTLADGLPYGVVTLDRRARVLSVNRAAADILADRAGLYRDARGLHGLRPSDDGRLQKALADAVATAGSACTLQLARPTDLRPLSVFVVPMPHEQPQPVLREFAPAAMVFLHDPARRGVTATGVLQRTFGLSRQQCRLALLLAEGASLAQAAERMGIARETAHSHLKVLFRKTGVRRQAELMRLLHSLPPAGDA